jgi:transglutaminase-like putative cysteine protease
VPERPGRVLLACAFPAFAISFAWLRIESSPRVLDALAVVSLALAPALLPRAWQRGVAAGIVVLAAAWLAFGSQPWELLPYRDEAVLGPLAEAAGTGVADFYGVVLPFEPSRSTEMHALVLAAIFGFTLAVALLVAARRPVAAAAVAVAGIGWPATLVSGQSVAIGALALAAALSIPLVLRARSAPALLAGAVVATIVVSGAAWASSATTVARNAALDWQTWDIRGPAQQAVGVRFAWDSNYDGISFPPTKTVVLTVEGPQRPLYWRASTLDLFSGDHWFEDLLWLNRIEADGDPLPADRLTPARGNDPDRWVEQRVEVKALVDDRLAAAGTPRAIESKELGTVLVLSGGVLRTRGALPAGRSYRVWSYVPDPAPAALAASPPRYPSLLARYRRIDGRATPPFGEPGREQAVLDSLRDPSYDELRAYVPVWQQAHRVAGRVRTPYQAVLALESWFRGPTFRYEEQPARAQGPPLAAFVMRTKEGYCQHYAGAMALMLRMLGIPARVAVGFTSGTRKDGKWVVSDHEAHAWVEAWFAGHGWVPFDPTPGRGSLGGNYSFASESAAAVAALRRGELDPRRVGDERPELADLAAQESFGEDRAPSLFGVLLLAAAVWVLLVGAGKWALVRARRLTRDPRRSAGASKRELECFLRDQGVALPVGGTLEDLRAAVHHELGIDGGPFVDAAARARYGPPEDAPRRAAMARRELTALLKRARAELSVWARVRGFVSLRSLRAG